MQKEHLSLTEQILNGYIDIWSPIRLIFRTFNLFFYYYYSLFLLELLLRKAFIEFEHKDGIDKCNQVHGFCSMYYFVAVAVLNPVFPKNKKNPSESF